MRIYCRGKARIRHRETGQIYEIESEELDWDVVDVDERQMGSELHYEAVVDHPELPYPVMGISTATIGRSKAFKIWQSLEPKEFARLEKEKYLSGLSENQQMQSRVRGCLLQVPVSTSWMRLRAMRREVIPTTNSGHIEKRVFSNEERYLHEHEID